MFSILTFLSASVGAFLTLISFLIFQLFFKIKIGAFFIFIIFLFFFGPLISSIELTDHIKVGEYLYSIIFERLSMISFYLPFGGNFDFPVSTVERSGIKFRYLISVFFLWNIFICLYRITVGNFIVHSPKLSLKSLTFFLLPLLIFLHGIVFYYPIIFIFASILAGRWTCELHIIIPVVDGVDDLRCCLLSVGLALNRSTLSPDIIISVDGCDKVITYLNQFSEFKLKY